MPALLMTISVDEQKQRSINGIRQLKTNRLNLPTRPKLSIAVLMMFEPFSTESIPPQAKTVL